MIESVDLRPRRSCPSTSARFLRPAGHDPAEHGYGLSSPALGPRRRPQLRAGRPATMLCCGHTTTSSPWATPPTFPRPKAGSVAHFAMDLFPVQTSCATSRAEDDREPFDGHANCFIETGHGKGLLIDFNYETEPLPGKYPLPGSGRSRCSRETEINHWGKVMFRWMYWNILLPGKELPLPAR